MTVEQIIARQIVSQLGDIDGETVEQIVRSLGMEKQIFRQLFFKADADEIEDLLEERAELEEVNKMWSKVNSNLGIR